MTDGETDVSPAEMGARAAGDPDAVEPTDETNNSMRDELNTILPGSDPLSNMTARHVGAHSFNVLSARNGTPTFHRVRLTEEPSCTCEDYQYNRDGREVCAHIVVAYDAKRMDVADNMAQEVMQAAMRLRESADDAQAIVESLNEATAHAREQEAENGRQSVAEANAEQSPSDGPDAETAAETLQDALDETVDDMQVTTAGGHVWIQTGKDTPDTLPGPGDVPVFDALLKDAEHVMFVHDDHTLADERPGEWWKNAIHPNDVDEYIEEVLQ